jgi:hypothetical protein
VSITIELLCFSRLNVSIKGIKCCCKSFYIGLPVIKSCDILQVPHYRHYLYIVFYRYIHHHHQPTTSPPFDIGLSNFSATTSSSRQPACANRHSTWPGGVLHYVYRDAISTPEHVYPSGCRFYCHFSIVIFIV